MATWLIHMLFGPIDFEQITAPQMDQRVRRHHQAEISELMTLGFDYLCSEGERFPLTRILRVVPALVAFDAWIQGEPIWVKDGTIIFGYPILFHVANPTFVELDASRATFVSTFEDGAVLITGNYDDPTPERPGVMKRCKPGTLVETWNTHLERLRALEIVGEKVDPSSDYNTYRQASAKERAAW